MDFLEDCYKQIINSDVITVAIIVEQTNGELYTGYYSVGGDEDGRLNEVSSQPST